MGRPVDPGFPTSLVCCCTRRSTSVAALEFSQLTGQQLFQPWRMLTSALVHSMGSPIHLLLNMAVLWLIGRQIEQFLGAAKFVAIYVLSAFGGAVAVLFLAEPNSAVVGASGAVYGLFAALWMIGRRLGSRYAQHHRVDRHQLCLFLFGGGHFLAGPPGWFPHGTGRVHAGRAG